MHSDRRAELVHRFARDTDEQREGVAVLLDADAFGPGATEAAPDAIRHVLDVRALFRTQRHASHPHAVLGSQYLLGIVIQALADDEDHLAVP